MAKSIKVYSYKDQRTLTGALLALLSLSGLVALYRAVVLLTFRDATNYTGDEVEFSGPQTALFVGDIAYLTLIVAIILGGFWIAQASRNAHSFGRKMKHSVGGSVGWYFVPVANLFMPYQSMAEIWRVSEPDGATGSRILPVWWTFWIIANILGNVVARTLDTPIPLLDAVSDVVLFCSLASFATLVWRLQQVQRQANATRVFSDPAESEAPPG